MPFVTEGEGRVVAGRYRLAQRPIGRGGMGVVWRAHDEYLHRDVAIKELRLGESADAGESEAAVRRMLREARAAAKLRHPGIVTVHDVVIEDNLPWIVMELIEGRSLADILDNDGPLPLDQAAQVGIQILRALDAAHHRGVLHRDVKPANIMLDGERVVLTDFGIALIDGASALTGTGQMPGSPEYIAPERIDGHEATRAADMWAAGVTLYATVVGRSPFKRKDIQSTLAAAASRDPDPDPRIGRLWPVIQGLLRKQPAERMEAKDAIERLNSVAGRLTPHGGPPRPSNGANTWIDNPSEQVTVVDETAPNTRTAPPLMPPPVYPQAVAPGDITLDPIPIQPPRKKNHGILIALGAALVVAIVVVVVALTSKPPPEGQQQQPQQQPSTTTSPQPPLVPYRELLGYTISIPEDWKRTESAAGDRTDVLYVGPQPDPQASAPEVQVRRDKTGTSAAEYLANRDQSVKADRENTDYKSSLAGDVLEYEHGSAAGPVRYHVLTKTVTDKQGTLFIMTFSLRANDPTTLQSEWQAVRPIATAIFNSFQFTT